jgi:glucose-1-phosphate cytidylyltransferase
MKAIIFAGGLGTRISEETDIKPKPMVMIGEKPLLWHIMKIYSSHGINDFIICLGYKGYVIKEYFNNYLLHCSDVTIDLKKNSLSIHQNSSEDWRVTLIETGLETMTGGRLQQAFSYLDDEDFCLTYGDCVSNIDITQTIKFHKEHKKIATVTAVRPSARFGSLKLSGNSVTAFEEKPKNEGGWINGGFFVLSKDVKNYLINNQTIWEKEPLEKLSADNQLEAYFHEGFWQPMDTLREKMLLEEYWENGAPWKIW